MVVVHARVAYLLDEREQGSLDGVRFDSREVDVGQAGSRHGWRGDATARVRAHTAPRAHWAASARHVAPPARARARRPPAVNIGLRV